MKDAATEVRRWLIVACHFVGPLLFFTNLTRNPYVTQIALVHAGVALAVAAWAWTESGREEGWRLPRLSVGIPLGLFVLAWALSVARAYFGHAAFFRPAMAAEGARVGVFMLVLWLGTFLLSSALAAEDDGTADVSVGGWVLFALVWGLLWTGFAAARAHAGGRPEDLWAFVWDPYGALLWGIGLAWTGWLTRRGRVTDFLHLALCAGFLASAYGVIQYFNGEFIWPYTLNPYGGRAVSTFGNPNFLSAYNVALMPVALALLLVEKNGGRRVVYGVLFLTLEGALLATLTRSSWMGSVVGCAALAFSPRLREALRAQSRLAGLAIGGAAAMALLWPSSAISTGYTPTFIGRFTEFFSSMKAHASYSPFHQRVLIWTSAWLMGSEAPLLGKGGGMFELFYPFYQGHLLHLYTFYQNMRTHANNSHNEILEIFSQTGLLGLGAYLAFWGTFFASAWKWAKGRAGSDPLWIGCAAGCAGVLADNMLNVSLHFAVPALLFWWLAGVAMGRGTREGGGRVTWKAPPGLRRAAAAAVVIVAAWVGWVQVRFWEREAWYFAGFKLVRMGDLPGAQRALERSRSWGPREVNALYELGNVYARQAKFPLAAETYEQSLQANAGYDEIYFNLGTVYGANLGKTEKALDYYETSWAINPLSPELINALSAYYLRDPGKYLERALAVIGEAVRDYPENPNYWNNYGYALSLAKRWAEAQPAYERALALAPDMQQAERNLAGMAAQSGRPRSPLLALLGDLRALDAALVKRDYSDKTVALAASVAKRAPELPKARFIYGSLLLARGKAAEAVPELETVVRLDPSRAAGRVNLGNAYAVTGRAAEAAVQFRAALAAEPGNAAALERLKALGAAP